MKKLFFTIALFLCICFSASSAKAQVMSQQLFGYNGVGTIFYPNGTYYGWVSNGFANGLGTFYFTDGSFYHGNFYGGFYHGQGVLFFPYQGYISGCFNMGWYSPCQNNYQSNNQVQNVVYQTQQEKPSSVTTSAVSPEGWTIEQIDPNTQMGKSLLGGYSFRQP